MKNIQITDSTLRLPSSVALTFKEKLEIAKLVSDLGVDIIEVKATEQNKADEVLIKTIATCVNKSIISCEVDCNEDKIEKAYSLIASANKKRLLISLPISPVQMEYFQNKKPQAVLEMLGNATAKATSLCADVEVCLSDATRAEKDFLYKAVATAIEKGAKTICINDIAGNILPSEFAQFILDIYANVPSLKSVNLAISCSDEFSMAASCVVEAILNGANIVKISCLGEGKMLSAQTISNIMDYICAKRGYGISLNKTAIGRTIKQLSGFATQKQPNQESDDIDNDVIKVESQTELNKIIKKRGYSLSVEDLKEVYLEFLRLSEKKSVSTKELEVIIANTAMQVPATYTLKSFWVNSSNILRSTASVELCKNGQEICGLSYGNGSVDASFLALEQVVGRHFELDDFSLGSVTEGKEAMGQAIVKLRNNGKVYSGRGVSTDIVGAAIRAYVNAINKIIYEEINE